MRRTIWTLGGLVLGALALNAGDSLAGKPGGGGGGGGGTGNTTPLDILYSVRNKNSNLNAVTLYGVQDDGSGTVTLATNVRGPYAWSPDGTQLAFYGLGNGTGTEEYGIYVTDVDGGTPRKLIALQNPLAGGLDWCPVQEADGTQRLAFTSRDDGTTDVWVARFDDSGLVGEPVEVSGSRGDYRWLSWSPSGEQIAVWCSYAIVLLDLADAESGVTETVVYRESATEPAPAHLSWANVGNELAFAAATDIYTLQLSHASGAWVASGLRNRTSSPNDDEGSADWSPDDRKLVLGNVDWNRGSGKSKVQVLDLTTGSRTTIASPGMYPVWKRSNP